MNIEFFGTRSSKSLYRLSLVMLIIGSTACEAPRPQIRDLIQPLKLTAGKADSLRVSDLFYAEHYDLNFQPHPDIDAKLIGENLVLQPKSAFEGMAALAFDLDGQRYHIPVHSQIKPTYTFRFQPETKPGKISVMGTFNSWNRSDTPMHDEDGDGVYEVTLALDAGRYQYEFVVDSREIYDPANPVKVPNGFGYFNSIAEVPPRHAGQTFLRRMGAEKSNGVLTLKFAYERDGQAEKLDKTQITALLDNRKIPAQSMTISKNQIEVSLDLYQITAEDVLRIAVTENGQSTPIQNVFLANQLDATPHNHTDWHNAVMYSIMIDRFADGDANNNRPVSSQKLSQKANYQGGDLQGILTKIQSGYFDSLGVNTLWLSPVNQNTDKAYPEWPPPHRYFSGYHGYWPIHHQRVDSRYGDMALLKKVVQEAHARDIKIILDFIANHVHEDHPFFRQHRDWFGSYDLPDGRKNIRLWDEYRLTTWFEPFLPSFDYPNSQTALDTMTDNAVWWLQQTGIDGFRQDAVKHIPNDFWRTLNRKIKSEVAIPQNRHVYQIGETFGGYDLVSSYVNNGQLDAQFNFNLYDVAKYVFLSPDADFSILAAELQRTAAVYGSNHLMGNVMDSHDKVRYMAFADGDISLDGGEAIEAAWSHPPQVDDPASYKKLQIYLAYLMTIPGLPTLYYGDEIGMTGAADPDNRRMMRFDDDLTENERDHFAQVRQIVGLRKQFDALRTGDFRTLHTDKDCLIFMRSEMNERLLIAINKSDQPQQRSIELPAIYGSKTATDVITQQAHTIEKHMLTLEVPPIGWRALLLQ